MNSKEETSRAPEPGEGRADELFSLVYEELRRIAAAKMAREAPGQTLQATALVHEAWLRLGGDKQPEWQSRAHFFAAAATAMRRILVDNARRKQAQRHGGGLERLDIEFLELAAPMSDAQLLALDEALERFAVADPQKAQLVKLRFFAGLTLAETAKTMGFSEPTAKRYWAYARAWLYRELDGGR